MNRKERIKNAEIKHEGKVVEITQEEIKVEIFAASACSSCHAKSICGASSGEEKIITIKRYNDGRFTVGESVNVVVKQSLGFKAVAIAYLIPLCILIILLLSLPIIVPNELADGLIAIGFVVVYYLILALFRKKLGTQFVFTVEKLK